MTDPPQPIRRRSRLTRSTLLVLLTAPAGHAQESAIKPADVWAQCKTVESELELIRWEMGKPQVGPSAIRILRASPRHVYFGAVALHRKADRLCFDLARTRSEPLPVPDEQLTPADVNGVVMSVLELTACAREQLNIAESGEQTAVDPAKKPTDVFNCLLTSSKQINVLLARRFAPSDVYQHVTLAIGYAGHLLSRFPGSERFPEPPAFERGKRPSDVFERLGHVLESIRTIAELSKVPPLTHELAADAGVEPSDVHDLAAVAIALLADLSGRLDPDHPPPQSYYPGNKLPSHVFQRVGILEAQLVELAKRVRERPDWLNR